MRKRLVALVIILVAMFGSIRIDAALAADPKFDQAIDSIVLADNLLQAADTNTGDLRAKRTADARVAAARDLLARAIAQIELAKQALNASP